MEFSPDGALKRMVWEEAKGKLRALVAIQGEYFRMDDQNADRFEEIKRRVEKFIYEFEQDGFDE